jgi:hypothetical protein
MVILHWLLYTGFLFNSSVCNDANEKNPSDQTNKKITKDKENVSSSNETATTAWLGEDGYFFLILGILGIILLLALIRISILIKRKIRADESMNEEICREARRHRFSKIRRNSSKAKSPWLFSLSNEDDETEETEDDPTMELDADRLIQSDISSEKELELITEHDPYRFKEHGGWEEYVVGSISAACLAGIMVFILTYLGEGEDEE